MTLWEIIQDGIWACNACKGNCSIELNIRQQTPAPIVPVTLLFVGIAPPDQGHPYTRDKAKSATNDPNDKLRRFIEAAGNLTWDHLIRHGGFLIHAVKCAIISDVEGFQNPRIEVIDRCSSLWFVHELELLQPARIVTFGGAARRAILK